MIDNREEFGKRLVEGIEIAAELIVMRTSKSLIIIEDEPIIALMMEEMVREAGYDVIGTAGSEAQAFALLSSTEPDIALLDINLGTTISFAVAAACRDRGIQVVFVTGYDPVGIAALCGNAPILSKPFGKDALRAALEPAAAA